MNRLTTLMPAAMTLLGLAALPQPGFAQSDPFVGSWRLNLEKSKFSPGPPWQEGFVMRIWVSVHYPSTKISSSPHFDTITYTREDAYTRTINHINAFKIVESRTDVLSPDGKTLTVTGAGTDASGRQYNNVIVFDKQ